MRRGLANIQVSKPCSTSRRHQLRSNKRLEEFLRSLIFNPAFPGPAFSALSDSVTSLSVTASAAKEKQSSSTSTTTTTTRQILLQPDHLRLREISRRIPERFLAFSRRCDTSKTSFVTRCTSQPASRRVRVFCLLFPNRSNPEIKDIFLHDEHRRDRKPLTPVTIEVSGHCLLFCVSSRLLYVAGACTCSDVVAINTTH